MIFDKLTTAGCIIPPPQPPDQRCEDPSFAMQHPSLCPLGALLLKPGIASICLADSINFSVFEYVAGVETELTTGLIFSSSNPDVFVIGVNSGSGTSIASGTTIITASYGTRTVSMTLEVQPSATCCNETVVASAIVVDNSSSMSLGFGGGYPSRLAFAKAVAGAYGGLIAEVSGVPKDSVGVFSVNSTLSALLAQSQDTTAILAAIAGISQTQEKTDLLTVFTVAAQTLIGIGADKPVLLLISDCEQSLSDRQAVLDAAYAFKAVGGIIVVIAPRASAVLQGFDLAERLATPGFFINASSATAANVLLQLNYLKKLLCAGSCVDPGERYENQPALDYSTFENWEVVEGIVNLLGPGLNDFLPGNGLYVELSGQSHAVIGTIDTFEVVAGQTYNLSFKAAGNQQSDTVSQSISASLRIGATTTFATNPIVFQQTVYPAWNDEFSTYNFSFTATYDATVRIYFEQNYTGTIVPGSFLDDVRFSSGDGVTLLDDNFDGENLVYIPPPCGGSAAVTGIDDPEAPTAEWLSEAGDDLNHIGQFTYGITYVTNEGETAVTTVLYQNLERFTFSEEVRRLNLPQPVPANVTSIRIWRSLGEGDAGAEPQNNTLFLLAEVAASSLSYLDSESAVVFTARHEASVEAPTVNTTSAAVGTFGYFSYVPCCYYYTTPGIPTPTNALVPLMTDNETPVDYLVSMGSVGTTNEEDWNNCWDQEASTRVALANASGVIDPATQWIQCQLPAAATVGSYSLTTRQTLPDQLAPTAWFLSGSQDGLAWTLLDTRTNITNWTDDVPRTFNVSVPGSFFYYRISFTAGANNNTPAVISEAQLYSGSTDDVTHFTNNCPPCEVPGGQVADTPPLADIETVGPQPVFDCTKTVRVTCPAGSTNAPDVDLVPVMTSATAPSGTVFFDDNAGQGEAAGFEAWKVFDGDPVTYMELVGTVSGIVGYQFPSAVAVHKYEMTARADTAIGSPKAWTLQGSNNGTTWTTLDTRTNVGWFAGQSRQYALTNTTAYTYYRLNITANSSGNLSNNLILALLEFYGVAVQYADGTATRSSSTNEEACRLATEAATAAALLSCITVYSATRSHTRSCEFGTVGSVTLSASATSLNNQDEANAAAQAAAEAATLAYLDAHPEVCYGSNNMSPITIPTVGNGSPYPSVLWVSESGTISKVTVNINGLTHGSPDDLRILLVGPTGIGVWLMKDAGGTFSVSNVNLVFDDAGATLLPDATQIVAGTFKPSLYSGNQLPQAPAPQSFPDQVGSLPGTALTEFNDTDKQGAWALYCSDDLALFGGSITSWTLTITASAPS